MRMPDAHLHSIGLQGLLLPVLPSYQVLHLCMAALQAFLEVGGLHRERKRERATHRGTQMLQSGLGHNASCDMGVSCMVPDSKQTTTVAIKHARNCASHSHRSELQRPMCLFLYVCEWHPPPPAPFQAAPASLLHCRAQLQQHHDLLLLLLPHRLMRRRNPLRRCHRFAWQIAESMPLVYYYAAQSPAAAVHIRV